MKKIISFLLFALSTLWIYAQHRFKIEVEAPSHMGESIFFSPKTIRAGFEELYRFEIDSSSNISNIGTVWGFESAVFQVNVQEKNIISGDFPYPQPVSFQYIDKKNKPFVSAIFFLDTGSYTIQLPEDLHSYQVTLNSPINKEYLDFKVLVDSLTDLDEKQQKIGAYIKKHPASFVALWEIIKDYTYHSYNPLYLHNLQLFSHEIRSTELFKKLETKLKTEQSTMAGGEFPTIQFDARNQLTKKDFAGHSYTVIDYWSTTCTPCIQSMPQLLLINNKYRPKGVHMITVTDERKPDRMKLAENILAKNNINWTNYFDIDRDFRDKVNATIYPLYFLVDRNGVIVKRVSRLNDIEKALEELVSISTH
jgi:Redoxin.